ncbi:protein IWS1 homolog 1-like [Jatropha curcas]|uniref:protein IWS1 homolog 1-like n=1 Tax=Jatropha curcas TaxID=180498 RepID=UPI0018947F98|nr:protein IWS1 homolog 1-like [Jatropha curcas]
MGEKGSFVVPELAVEDEEEGFGRKYATEGKKRKKVSGKERKKVSKGEKKYGISGGEEGSHSKSGLMKKGMYSEKLAGKEDGEVKGMWDTIAGGDSEVLSFLFLLFFLKSDLEQYDRREQLKKSGLAKVIMFLSKSDEETRSNRKLAKDLVDKWSRPIFDKSTRFEDMRNINDDRAFRRPTIRRPVNNSTLMECTDGDLDLDISRERRSGQSSSRQRASRPEATPLEFVVRPQSKIDPEEIRARAKQVLQTKERKKKLKRKLCIT